MQRLTRLQELLHAILFDGMKERFVRRLVCEEAFRPDGRATLLVDHFQRPSVSGASEAIDLHLYGDAFAREEARQGRVLKLAIWDYHKSPPHMLVSGMSLHSAPEASAAVSLPQRNSWNGNLHQGVAQRKEGEIVMLTGGLMWLIGIPIPVILLLWFFFLRGR
jgi:hypothetical protein